MTRSLILAAALPALTVASSATVTLSATQPQAVVKDTFAAFTIDSADLYYGESWTSVQLVNLVRQLSVPTPAIIRLGGSASNDWQYRPTGYSTDGTHTIMNNTVWDAVNAFISSTTALFAYTRDAKYATGGPVGWEIGNEIASGDAGVYGMSVRYLRIALEGT